MPDRIDIIHGDGVCKWVCESPFDPIHVAWGLREVLDMKQRLKLARHLLSGVSTHHVCEYPCLNDRRHFKVASLLMDANDEIDEALSEIHDIEKDPLNIKS